MLVCWACCVSYFIRFVPPADTRNSAPASPTHKSSRLQQGGQLRCASALTVASQADGANTAATVAAAAAATAAAATAAASRWHPCAILGEAAGAHALYDGSSACKKDAG